MWLYNESGLFPSFGFHDQNLFSLMLNLKVRIFLVKDWIVLPLNCSFPWKLSYIIMMNVCIVLNCSCCVFLCLLFIVVYHGFKYHLFQLAVAVKFKQYDILTQNAFVTLTQQMWLKFARWYYSLSQQILSLNCLVLSAWFFTKHCRWQGF